MNDVLTATDTTSSSVEPAADDMQPGTSNLMSVPNPATLAEQAGDPVGGEAVSCTGEGNGDDDRAVAADGPVAEGDICAADATAGRVQSRW